MQVSCCLLFILTSALKKEFSLFLIKCILIKIVVSLSINYNSNNIKQKKKYYLFEKINLNNKKTLFN